MRFLRFFRIVRTPFFHLPSAVVARRVGRAAMTPAPVFDATGFVLRSTIRRLAGRTFEAVALLARTCVGEADRGLAAAAKSRLTTLMKTTRRPMVKRPVRPWRGLAEDVRRRCK